jgi:DNA-binding PadR family transcriptional regulator
MHHFYHFIGRHRHPGLGHFGRGFMGGGMGGRGFGMGRKLGSSDLQLLVLKLLEEKPRYGYEIIKELEERSKGFYVPSPGMVYPALTYLEELGHATVAADGARKLYSITAPGKEHLTLHLAAADALLAQFGRVGERMDRVRRALDADEGGDEGGDESEADHERRGSRELHRARRDLKLALLDKWHSSREEQQRIAAILIRAAAEIAGK